MGLAPETTHLEVCARRIRAFTPAWSALRKRCRCIDPGRNGQYRTGSTRDPYGFGDGAQTRSISALRRRDNTLHTLLSHSCSKRVPIRRYPASCPPVGEILQRREQKREPAVPGRFTSGPFFTIRTTSMANTVIGSTIVIDGEITGDEDLIILGTVKGRIGLRENILVESGGVVEASVETATIVVNGSVTGDINATDRIDLRTESHVIGDVRAPRILIADGASFKGNVDMDG